MKMSSIIERHYPFAIAGLSAIGYVLWHGNSEASRETITLIGAAVCLYALGFGFLAAFVSNLDLRNVSTISIEYFRIACRWAASLAVVSMIVMFGFRSHHHPIWLVSAWIFMGIASAICTFRAYLTIRSRQGRPN
jgi:hypothetical protein